MSAGNPFRRWPASHFVELAVQLAANDPDRRIILTSGPSEAEAARAIVAQARQRLPEGVADRIRTGDEYTLAELRSLVARAAVYVGGDSGPLHVAATSDVPIVGLYGPTLPVAVGAVAPPGRADGGGRAARPRLPAVRPASVRDRRLPVPDGNRARRGGGGSGTGAGGRNSRMTTTTTALQAPMFRGDKLEVVTHRGAGRLPRRLAALGRARLHHARHHLRLLGGGGARPPRARSRCR